MNDRYSFDNNTVFNNAKGRVYTSVYFPEIPVRDSDLYIITKETDRLDLLASRFYNDVTAWWIIAHANNIIGTFYIAPGTQLRIPTDISQISSNLNTINNI